MVDPRHPMWVLANRPPGMQIGLVLARHLERKVRIPGTVTAQDMLGEHEVELGGGVGIGGQPRVAIRPMATLPNLKNPLNLSDEVLVVRWSENVVSQFFRGCAYREPRLPCDATQIGPFRKAIAEEGLEQLLNPGIQTAAEIQAIKHAKLARVIVDSTVQEGASALPVDIRSLQIAGYRVVKAAQATGRASEQTFAVESKELLRKAGGYAHQKQFKRLKKVAKRQRTVLGVVRREVQGKLDAQAQTVATGSAPEGERAGATLLGARRTLLERAERIRT